MNIFEQASRLKLRFTTPRGDLATEDLWSLPLQSDTKVNLDTLARMVAKQIREREAVESFVEPTRTAGDTLDLQLDILKFVIASRKADNAALLARRAAASEVEMLQGLLAKKQNEALESLSEEEIQARLAALKAAS
jgi:hypothetical protein